MSQAIPETIGLPLTDSELWEAINTLAVSLQDFSVRTYLYARVFGVINGVDDGNAVDFTVNRCLRSAMYRVLYQAQETVENIIGYPLSERYHYEDIPFDIRGRLQLNHFGLDSIGVSRSWTDLDNVTLSDYYIETGLTPVVDGDGVLTLTISNTLTSNPREAIIRDSNRNVYEQLWSNKNYPQRSGSNWVIALDTATTPYVSGTLNVQHRKYVTVTVTVDSSIPKDEVVLTYPGTNQIVLPYSHTMEVAGTHVFTLYTHSLVDPGFYDEETNLEQGQFYKLLNTLEVKQVEEVASTTYIVRKCSGLEDAVEETDAVTIQVLDPTLSIIQVNVPDYIRNGLFNTFTESCYSKPEYFIRIYYKTSPNKLSSEYKNAVSAAKEAIIFRAATDLPVKVCGCKMSEENFIGEQQSYYDVVYTDPLTGAQQSISQSNNLMGDHNFRKAMEKVPKIPHIIYLKRD